MSHILLNQTDSFLIKPSTININSIWAILSCLSTQYKLSTYRKNTLDPVLAFQQFRKTSAVCTGRTGSPSIANANCSWTSKQRTLGLAWPGIVITNNRNSSLRHCTQSELFDGEKAGGSLHSQGGCMDRPPWHETAITGTTNRALQWCR